MITSFDMQHSLSTADLNELLDMARSKGFVAGLEVGAEIVWAVTWLSAPEKDLLSDALRERATHEKQMAISKVLMEKDAEILRVLAGTEDKS